MPFCSVIGVKENCQPLRQWAYNICLFIMQSIAAMRQIANPAWTIPRKKNVGEKERCYET